ncbi:MAG: hypothetical protein J0I73_18240 [Sphingomonas sp.]|uniref:amidase n=2 Tax=unclassified Sphingomonas TaxID=196159 RepID=UPI001ACBEE19|nr:amidase family protein [Sphingomonas sp.]MBN8850002.1 hypothetical protein [Sphingomonas sp.]
MPTDISFEDMVAMGRAVEEGATTPLALVERAIERVEAVNGQLNFILTRNYDQARAQAARPPSGPFSGVPTLIKDHVAQKGLPLTFGCPALRNYVPTEDAPYIQAIEQGGLVSIARSTLPELGLNVVTESPWFGITRNPWNPDYTSGGSSGGGAAAVAAGAVPVAHASDGLGSIRHGAGPCGLVGLKPSRGRNVGDEAMRSISDLVVSGCVSRTVRDTDAWLQITQSRDPGAAHAPIAPVTEPLSRKLRIRAYGSLMRTGGSVEASVGRVFAETISLLDRLGHSVSDGALPFDGPQAIENLTNVAAGRFARSFEAIPIEFGHPILFDDLEYRSQTLVEAGRRVDDAQLADLLKRMEVDAAAYLRMFDEIDIWMTPTHGTEIPKVEVLGPTTSWDDTAHEIADYAGFCWIDNFAGSTAITLPIGLSDRGLPVGVQFATKPGGEGLLLALALQIEAVVQWWRRTPPIWVGDASNRD